MDNADKLLEQYKISTHWGNIVKDRLEFVIKFSGKNILDVGCATGEYVGYLLDNGYNALGCDILEYEKWKEIGEENFIKTGIYKLPYKDASQDTVLLFEVLEHLDEPLSALREIHRVCDKNIILSVPNCDTPGEFNGSGLNFNHWIDRTHVNFFKKDSVIDIIRKAGFEIVELKYINQIFPEIICLNSWNIPEKLISILSKFLNRMNVGKKHYMTIIVVANKVKF